MSSLSGTVDVPDRLTPARIVVADSALRSLALILFASVALEACTDANPTTPAGPAAAAAPAVVASNGPIAVTVGQTITYDASQGGATFGAVNPGGQRGGGGGGAAAGLSYAVTFAGTSNGLTAVGPTVTGRPLASAVTWATITATDAQGRSASDRFALVAFPPGLATPTLPGASFSYTDAANPLPAHFRALVDGATVVATDNTPSDNPITDAGATLGRVLFYDMRLSRNNGLSCGGCHGPSISFSDTPALSVGFAGGLTGRHTPSLANARFYQRGHFFWDERAATLEVQVLGPIQNGTEMGMTLEDLTAKLQTTSYYPPLFQRAFASTTITSDRVARALAQYVRSLVSTNSKYDRAFTPAGTPNFAAVFTPQEIQGEQLFRTTGCASCHTTVAQVSDDVHNIGLDAVTSDTGAGNGRLKAPSLRNVAVLPRFMHDGRFTSLAQVIDFFDSGVQANPDLDARLRNVDGSPRRLGLTAAQKAALVAYLYTLTDSTFLTAARFSNPFAPAGVTTPTTPAAPTPPPTVPTAPTPAPPPASAPATAAVIIQANAYHPATVTVARGAVVTWTNLDNARHSAGFLTAGVGATPIFTSGSQSITMPAAPGTYQYQCAVHGAAMQGTVIVQ